MSNDSFWKGQGYDSGNTPGQGDQSTPARPSYQDPQSHSPADQTPGYQPGGGSDEPTTPMPTASQYGSGPYGAGQYSADQYSADQYRAGQASQTGPFGQASGPMTGQTATATRPAPRRRGLASLVAVAVLAAGIGGGAGVLVDRGLTSQASGTTTTSTTNPGGTVTTKVVQGDTSNPDWSVTAAAVEKSVVSITVTSGSSGDEGTGVVVDSSGHVVTNNHVVSSAGTGATITVQIGNASYPATVVGTDPSTDLAVLKITDPPSGLAPITFADSSTVSVGDPVMAVGNPLGLSDTVTTGIVSALNRPVVTQQVSNTVNDGSGSGNVYTSAIQTSAPINPGNSGGALVNADGQLVGINSSIASLNSSSSSSTSGSIGIGFAIPSNLVKYIADQLIATGSAQHAYLGISTSDGQATSGGATLSGAKVAQIVSGGPAAAADLRAGDLITGLDGVPIGSADALVAETRACKVGQKVTLTVIRDGATKKIEVTLGKASQTTTQAQNGSSQGYPWPQIQPGR